MGNTCLADVQKLIMWGESLSHRLRTDPAALKPDELECPDFMLDPPFDVQAPQQIGFLNCSRKLLSDMKIAKIAKAAAALRVVAGISFLSTVGDNRGKLAKVIKALKTVRDALLLGTARRSGPAGRPTDVNLDEAYKLYSQRMKDPTLRQRYPNPGSRKQHIIEELFPGFADKGYTKRKLQQGITAGDRKKAVRRKEKMQKSSTN
jgi:hypothetical protein